MKTRFTSLLMLLAAIHVLGAAEGSLVPDTPSSAPDYFCTWNVQGFVCSYENASVQADAMVEANLFGNGPNQNWLGFYPAIRGDLTFLLDDAFDFPIGGGHNHPARGSVELDAGRFPSYKGTPAERLASLCRDVKASGWRDLGLWICNSRPNLESLPIDSDSYWCERLAWSQQAGVRSWKVDWGIGVSGKPLWKFKLTPKTRAMSPDIWIEQGGSGAVGDLYRTYDVHISVSIPETISRVAQFLSKVDPKDRRIINCEDEVYIGAALGCSYGIMRHPFAGNLPNGKTDSFFTPYFRDVKHRMDEVVRAVRWHRIAQPFPKGDNFQIDERKLTDFKSRPAPARISRGGLPLPTVTMADGSEPPYVLCSRHPDGEIAIATLPRNLGEKNAAKLVFPLAAVTLDIGSFEHPVGIFGEFASLTLVATNDLAGKHIQAQDLAGDTPTDITAEVKVDGGKLIIPGPVIHRVGLMAGKPGDISDPGLLLVVKDLTSYVPKKPMRPGMYMSAGPVATDNTAPKISAGQKRAEGTAAKLRLSADKAILPDDGAEVRLTVAVLDAADRPIGNNVKGKISITEGKGLFPTGESFEFNTLNGEDSIEFRSYNAGKVRLTATAAGLEAGSLEISVIASSKDRKKEAK